MNEVPFIIDSDDPANAQSFAALGSLKNQFGLAVTNASQHPQDPNRLVLTLAPQARAFGSPQPIRAMAAGAAAAGGGAAPLRILCVHGVNHLEPDAGATPTPAEQAWREAIAQAMAHWGGQAELQFVAYNEHFENSDLNPAELALAVARLSASGFWHGVKDVFGGGARAFGPQGGLADTVEWTAGMVSEWAGDDKLRADLRATMLDAIKQHQPQLILAHSMGTLIAYDTLARPANAGKPGLAGATLATFGSQIGHPTVRQVLGGRIIPIPALRHWFHLYNRNDNVFTARLDVRFKPDEAPNFSQHATTFDLPWDPLNHDATQYMLHQEALRSVWRDAATQAGVVRANLPGMPRLLVAGATRSKKAADKPAGPAIVSNKKKSHRAFLVGISQYPNPANNLAGCVNDVFLMSRLLQEADFPAENIRILLNERATSDAILERLEWLLDGSADGQNRVFYFAGHGAQIPAYGAGETVDSLDECLVPYNFAWSRETAVLDDQFYEMYSQLPENTQFLTIFDCCHSGGMTREGGLLARGLTPPDDIRHRLLKWDPNINTFTERKIAGETVVPRKQGEKAPDPRHGRLHQLGCATGLRSTDKPEYDKARRDFGHNGPFMPFIIQACDEKQLAYEYRHGSESNGAFTWFLAKILQGQKGKKPLSWEQLVQKVASTLHEQGYPQTPQLVCPTKLRAESVPWRVEVETEAKKTRRKKF